jgi:hypothetical protein
VLWLAQILSKIKRSSPSPRIFHAQESATVRADSSLGEASGGREEVVRGLGQAGKELEKPPAASQVGTKNTTIARSLRRCSKVFKMDPPFHCDPIGSNHIEFGSP